MDTSALTLLGLGAVLDAPRPPRVHGLKDADLKRLPFNLELQPGQVAKTCICDSGWVVVCPIGDERANFEAHVQSGS